MKILFYSSTAGSQYCDGSLFSHLWFSSVVISWLPKVLTHSDKHIHDKLNFRSVFLGWHSYRYIDNRPFLYRSYSDTNIYVLLIFCF